MKIRSKSTEPRNTVLTIRLSNTEKAELKQRASNLGLSVGAFLVHLALSNNTNCTKSTPGTQKRTHR